MRKRCGVVDLFDDARHQLKHRFRIESLCGSTLKDWLAVDKPEQLPRRTLGVPSSHDSADHGRAI